MFESRTAERAARGVRKVKLALLGPAFIAAIGYIDPGNFATNIQAGVLTATNCCGWWYGPTSWPC